MSKYAITKNQVVHVLWCESHQIVDYTFSYGSVEQQVKIKYSSKTINMNGGALLITETLLS